MIMATHDIEEAVYPADRVVVLANGGDGIGDMIPVALPRTRDRSDRQFVNIRQKLIKQFNLNAQ